MLAPPPLAVHLPDGADLPSALAGLKEGLTLTPVAVLLTDADLAAPGPRITYANPAMGELCGWPAAELVGRTPRLFQGPKTDRAVLDRLAAELRAGRPFSGAAVNYRRDGTPYPVSWSILPVLHRGRVVRYVSHQAAATDLAPSAVIAFKDRARLSEERFDLAVTACGLGFWDLDVATGEAYLSPGWKEQLGYADHELPNHLDTFTGLLHPDDRDRVREAVGRTAAGIDPEYRQEFRLRHRAGRWVWIATRGGAARDAAGRAVRLVGLHTDITAQKAAEEAVRTGAERLRALLEHARDMVGVYALDGRLLYTSDRCRRVLGFAPEDLVGQSGFDHLHPDDRPAAAAALAQLVARPGVEVMFETRFRRADGGYVPVEAVAVNLADAPAVGGILASCRDITERRRLETLVRQGHKLEALGQLCGGVAHDFNNLLTVILGSLDLLAPPSAADRELLDQVRAAGDRARGLVGSLLRFARRDEPARPRPTDLGQLLAATAEVLRRTLDKRIRVVVDIAAGLPAVVCDPGAVEQAVVNLALNARDAMPAAGTLTVAAGVVEVGPPLPHPDAHPGRYVAVAVADTGTGMTPEVLARAFEPFFTTKEPGKGTGLGLTMVADTARRLGGWAAAASETGRGTRVELLLPADEPAAAGPRALVIDDEDMVRTVAAAVLARAGWAVEEAADGPAGLAAYRRRPADVVLLDLTLPGVPGEEVLAELRRADPAARVLVVSGLLPDRPPAGAAGVLAKPFTPDRLMAAVRAAAGRPPAG